MSQESLALLLVALAFTHLILLGTRRWLVPPVARLLLQGGRVKAAMWLRSRFEAGGCSDCE